MKRFIIRASNNYPSAADWDACWAAYDSLVSSGEIEDMDYDELIDAISEMTDIPSQLTYTIVDEFIANETDRNRMAYASTRNRRTSNVYASRRPNHRVSTIRSNKFSRRISF